MIKLIIFDFAGTLAYFDRSDLRDFFDTLIGRGFKIKGEAEAEYVLDFLPSFFSKAKDWRGIAEMLAEKYGVRLSSEKKNELAKDLKKKLSFKLYEDVRNILNLSQRKAILTLSSRFLVDSLPELKNFDIFTPREIRCEKPDKKAFLTVLNKLKTIPEEAAMVGDNLENDIIPARALGMKAILIDRENKIPAEIAQDPTIVKITSLKELKSLL